MKSLFSILLLLIATVCNGQSVLVEKADSLFEAGHYSKAIGQFQLASAAYRKQGNWAMVLTCQDAQRICMESMGDWDNALASLQKGYTLNKDSLHERFEYNTIAYAKNSALRITPESLEYFRKLLSILENWKGSRDLQDKIRWYCSEGSRQMQEIFLNGMRYLLKSNYLIATEEYQYEKPDKWLKRLLDKKLIGAERLVKNGQDSANFYYAKSLDKQDSSVWFLYRASEEWIKTGSFNSDSVFLSFVTYWMNKEPKEWIYPHLLGGYYERQLNYDEALLYYGRLYYVPGSTNEYYNCIVRKANAFKNGLITSHITPRDTAEANRLVKKAMKDRKKKEYSSWYWSEAARVYIKFNCWKRAFYCIYNADIDEYRDELGGDVSKYLSLAQLLAPIVFEERSQEFGMANWQIGQVLLSRNENHPAFQHLSKAVSVFESKPSGAVKLSELYYATGNASRNLMDFETAIRYHEKSLSEYQKAVGTNPSTLVDLHSVLSDEYYEAGEYGEAIRHLDWCWKSNTVKQNMKKWMPMLKFMEGKILLAQDKKGAAIKSFEVALKNLQEEEIKQVLVRWKKFESSSYDSKKWKAIDKLVDETKASVDLRLKVLNSMAPLLPKENIGECEREIDLLNHIPGFFYSISAYTRIESFNFLGSQIVGTVSKTNQSSSWYNRASGVPDSTILAELETAWGYFWRAIVINSINNYNPRDVQQETLENPPLGIPGNPEINSYQFGDQLLISYLGRANICFQYFMCGRDSSYLSDSQDYLMKCDSILSRARKFYSNENAKLKLAELGVKVYEMGTRVSMMLAVNHRYERDKAFQFMEKGKSNILRQSLSEVKAQYFSGVPDSLFDQEKDLKSSLFEFHRKLADDRSTKNLSEAQLDSLKDQVFVLEQSLRDFNTALEEKYPKYFHLKNSENAVEHSWYLDNVLNRDEAIVEYQVGEENIFVAIYRDKKPFHLIAITNDTLLPRYIKRLRNSLIFQLKDEFILSSNWLYEKVFKSVDHYLDKSQIKKVIIIPDNLLGYIPFEVLIPKTQATEYEDLPYLIKKFEIRYMYSAGMFLEQSRYQPLTEDSAFVAFAPIFNDSNKTNFLVKSCDRFYDDVNYESTQTRAFSRDGNYITPLPFTEGEVKTIVSSLRAKNLFAKFFLFQDAREEVLKSDDMIRYKYIHMATHGIINDHFPSASGLLLSQDSSGKEDGILYTGEIYSMKLNAELVVLSACETGLGKVVKGEGIIGLTRGWLYAGAKNLVVSLWKVADKSTSEFMVTFYDFLFSGKSKAEALQLAKLEMIKNPTYREPFFWAPFILIGN